MIRRPQKIFFYLFETQILNGMRSTFPPPTLSKVPLDASRGVAASKIKGISQWPID